MARYYVIFSEKLGVRLPVRTRHFQMMTLHSCLVPYKYRLSSIFSTNPKWRFRVRPSLTLCHPHFLPITWRVKTGHHNFNSVIEMWVNGLIKLLNINKTVTLWTNISLVRYRHDNTMPKKHSYNWSETIFFLAKNRHTQKGTLNNQNITYKETQ